MFFVNFHIAFPSGLLPIDCYQACDTPLQAQQSLPGIPPPSLAHPQRKLLSYVLVFRIQTPDHSGQCCQIYFARHSIQERGEPCITLVSNFVDIMLIETFPTKKVSSFGVNIFHLRLQLDIAIGIDFFSLKDLKAGRRW